MVRADEYGILIVSLSFCFLLLQKNMCMLSYHGDIIRLEEKNNILFPIKLLVVAEQNKLYKIIKSMSFLEFIPSSVLLKS